MKKAGCNSSGGGAAVPDRLLQCGERADRGHPLRRLFLWQRSGAGNGLISTETATVSELTPQALAEALSLWTGLDFTLNAASVEETAITVDWAADSTLVAGPR